MIGPGSDKKHICLSLQLFWIDCHDVLTLQNLAIEIEKSADKVYTIDKPRTSMDNTRNTELKDKRMLYVKYERGDTLNTTCGNKWQG